MLSMRSKLLKIRRLMMPRWKEEPRSLRLPVRLELSNVKLLFRQRKMKQKRPRLDLKLPLPRAR
jgi:hypothetical protein